MLTLIPSHLRKIGGISGQKQKTPNGYPFGVGDLARFFRASGYKPEFVLGFQHPVVGRRLWNQSVANFTNGQGKSFGMSVSADDPRSTSGSIST